MSHYVKFTYERARPDTAPFDALAELNACRRKLLQQRLIGVDSNGVGFGNLSVRDGASGNFYITGSTTGGLPELRPTDCVRVVAFDFARNWLGYEGGIVTFGKNLEDAFDVLMRARELPKPCDAGRQYAGQNGQNARAPQ